MKYEVQEMMILNNVWIWNHSCVGSHDKVENGKLSGVNWLTERMYKRYTWQERSRNRS